uniref:MIP/aquaporin family protein n=1 Tax=Streptomyces angustmyceticus TaxID=285578 RepID=UPI000D199124
ARMYSGTEWSKVPLYILAQMVGAAIGAVLAWALYYAQFAANAEADKAQPTLGIFSTGPEIRNPAANLVTEIIATVGLVLPLLFFGQNKGIGIGQVPGEHVGVYGSGINVLLVALLVVGIGLSLGGPTGYAINPARDLGPRLVHALLPIPNKGSSDWGYSWIPVAGPLIGAVLSGLVYNAAF